MANAWFETVAVAQRRAKKRLPKSVYSALIAGSERGLTLRGQRGRLRRTRVRPARRRPAAQRDLATTVMGQQISLPVIISPTGVQAVHPDGEVAVARAAAARGTAIGLSSFASKPVEEVVAANPQTFFQIYWVGSRDDICSAWSEPARPAPSGLIADPGLVVLPRPRLGQPRHPRKDRPASRCSRFAPETLIRPAGCSSSSRPAAPRPHRAQHGRPRRNRARPSSAPTASGCRPHRRPGRTSPGCASSGAARSCSRASPGWTTPAAPSTPASPRSRSPTTAATTSTARRPRSGRCPPSPRRSAARSRYCSTAASAAAATSSRRSPSAPAPS